MLSRPVLETLMLGCLPETEGSHLLLRRSRPGSHWCPSLYLEEMWLTSAGSLGTGAGGAIGEHLVFQPPPPAQAPLSGAASGCPGVGCPWPSVPSGESRWGVLYSYWFWAAQLIPWLASVKTPPARRFVLKAAWRFSPDLMACGWTYCGLPSNRNTIM